MRIRIVAGDMRILNLAAATLFMLYLNMNLFSIQSSKISTSIFDLKNIGNAHKSDKIRIKQPLSLF
jgi:hypothetical protein